MQDFGSRVAAGDEDAIRQAVTDFVTTTRPERRCVLCPASGDDHPDLTQWLAARLPSPVDFAGTQLSAGDCWVCPPCASWLPEARTAPLPPNLLGMLDALAGTVPEIFRGAYRANVLGALRHVGRELVRAEG
ncbi:hypothetical protein [Actinoplanes solisilvae]|uniref:hypothetical protein n=1 Tax=Actinoplanes solisilvae TaxID=2486853 RepID=UPI000FDCC3DE|nr:hypothetical protein [Actinoplanes solisilvae]